MCIAIWHLTLKCSAGTKTPTQVTMVTTRWITALRPQIETSIGWFLRTPPVTLPPTNQKKVMHPATLTPIIAFKNPSLSSELPDLLAGCRHSFFHYNPMSVSWLCCEAAKYTHVQLVTPVLTLFIVKGSLYHSRRASFQPGFYQKGF